MDRKKDRVLDREQMNKKVRKKKRKKRKSHAAEHSDQINLIEYNQTVEQKQLISLSLNRRNIPNTEKYKTQSGENN